MKKILFVLGIIGFILNVEVCPGQKLILLNLTYSEPANKKLKKGYDCGIIL